jgi:ATP-binding cassette subfamily C (CFTR/MRP) protein 1
VDISSPSDQHHSGLVVCSKETESSTPTTSSEIARNGDGHDMTSRQTGDVQIYLYYIKSVGILATLVFVVAIVGFIFCISFPSK